MEWAVVIRRTSTYVGKHARTDPNEQESVVLLPDLEPLVPA